MAATQLGISSSDLPCGPTGANAEDTKQYGLSHTMYRISNPLKSLPFYCEGLGMKLLYRMDSEGGKFTNYFLGYPSSTPPHSSSPDFQPWLWSQQGLLELCHNWGDEIKGTKYCNGNEPEHKGFGHICVFVDELHKAVARFDALGFTFCKRPEDGTMKHIAFLSDPDGYRVEIINRAQR